MVLSPDQRTLHLFRDSSRQEMQVIRFPKPFYEQLLEKVAAYEPREDAQKYITILSKKELTLTDGEIQQVVDALTAKGLQVLWLGSSQNEAVARAIIAQTGGEFRLYTNYDSAMTELADMVKGHLPPVEENFTRTVKKGEEVSYEQFYFDIEGDPMIEDTVRWKYRHVPNNDGLASFHNQWLAAPITSFDRDGTYFVSWDVIDNPPPADTDSRFEEYRRHAVRNELEVIVYGDSPPPVPDDVPPQLNVSVSGDLRLNHRVDFVIQGVQGTHPIDWSTLDVSFGQDDHRPYADPDTREFSRVFKDTGTHEIMVTVADTEGNTVTETVTFDIADDLPPVADFTITGDGKRNEEGFATFTVTNEAAETDDPIGTIEYYKQGTKYVENPDGTLSPDGTTFHPITLNELGEIETDEVGTNTFKQVVSDYYINGTGLAGENLDLYRVFQTAEVTRTVDVVNELPQLEYEVLPPIVEKGRTASMIEHFTTVEDDLVHKVTTTYRFEHDPNHYPNSDGADPRAGSVTNQPEVDFTRNGAYTFYAKTDDYDGETTGWVEGGTVIVATPPTADFELVSKPSLNGGENLEYGDDNFATGSTITLENRSVQPDYGSAVPNHGIASMKVEVRDVTEPDWTTVFEEDNMASYQHEVNLPVENDLSIHEVRLTVTSEEGFTDTVTKPYRVMEIRVDGELDPEQIATGGSYTIHATTSLDATGAVARIHDGTFVQLQKTGEDADDQFFEATVTTPNTLPDGDYTIEVYGIYPFNQEARDDEVLTVDTPVDVTGYVNGVEEGGTAVTDRHNTFSATTSVYVDTVQLNVLGADYFLNLAGDDGSTRTWEREVWIPAGTPEGEYVARYEATTTNGNTGYDTSTFTLTANRPPVAGFDYAPQPTWEGDTVQITSTAYDPDDDPLDYEYVVTDPSGDTQTFTVEHPAFSAVEVGTWTVRQTVTDPYGESDSVTQTFDVQALEITSALVNHHPDWDAYRADQGRPPHYFYAGESFFFYATTNQPAAEIEVSVDIPFAELRGGASPYQRKYTDFQRNINGDPIYEDETLSTLLNEAAGEWTGKLGDDNTDPELWAQYGSDPPGLQNPIWEWDMDRDTWLDFTFTATFPNGTVKTEVVQVKIDQSIIHTQHTNISE